MKVIGTPLIESRSYQPTGASARIISPKDFSCDSIVLILHREDDVLNFISMRDHQDLCSIGVTSLNFFMRVHLLAVNSKCQLKPIERVHMVWHSFFSSLIVMALQSLLRKACV